MISSLPHFISFLPPLRLLNSTLAQPQSSAADVTGSVLIGPAPGRGMRTNGLARPSAGLKAAAAGGLSEAPGSRTSSDQRAPPPPRVTLWQQLGSDMEIILQARRDRRAERQSCDGALETSVQYLSL